MDAYIKKLEEISESLDQLLKERDFLLKDFTTKLEKISTVQAVNENMDKINTIDLLLKINLNMIKTHASLSGQGDSFVFNELMKKIAEAQTKLISFRSSEHLKLAVISANNAYNAQTPFLKPPSPSSGNDNSYSPNSDF